MKIVINECYGGFGISDAARKLLRSKKYKYDWEIKRDDPKLIDLIEKKGSEFVSDQYACLAIADIPEEATDYKINDYDGYESIIYVIDGKIKTL